jgi:hypothetical protein
VTGACARLAAIWDVPHHTVEARAGALEELQAEIRGLADADLTPVVSWAYEHTVRGRFQFWVIYALAHIERDSRRLACKDCASEVRGHAGERWRYRVIHSATCPWWREYQAGRVKGPVPCGAVVTHRGPYKRRAGAR